MAKLYIYVVDRDFGFAPNPFHGTCSLATCKPIIRRTANLGDWIIGVGGGRLAATGRCVFAMRVTEKITFNEYWSHPEFRDKKPVRNGSRRMMVGDNIYHFDGAAACWRQLDSHHSNPDGSTNTHNLQKDTETDKVLLSRHFYYFGRSAPIIPASILSGLPYRNGRAHRVYDVSKCTDLLEWLLKEQQHAFNCVAHDPFDFDNSEKRYSAGTNKIT